MVITISDEWRIHANQEAVTGSADALQELYESDKGKMNVR